MEKLFIRGKQEFSEFVNLINKLNISITGDARESLKELINVWKKQTNNDDFIYLNNFEEYDDITNFVKKSEKLNLAQEWYKHVEKITTHKITSSDEKYIKLNLASIEFKLKFNDDQNKLSNSEIKMFDFFRQLEAISILTKSSTYNSRSLIDKLMINSIELPYNNVDNHIEIKESSGKGLGVFATDDISENSIITFYPIHGYCLDGSNIYKTSSDMKNLNNYEDHCFVLDDNFSVIANPRSVDNTLLLGHMINDSVGNTFNEPIDSHSIKNGIYEYVQKSNNNCLIKVNKKYGIIYVISTSHIYKGDELFTSYSPYFWFSRVSKDTELFYNVCSSGKMIEFLNNNMFNC